MVLNKKLLKNIAVLFLFYCQFIFGVNYDYRDNNSDNNQTKLVISQDVILPIGIKIWFNESGGEVSGLTDWNDGEDFASVGIGHFVWHPSSNKDRASHNSGFPGLINYIEKRGDVIVPTWLRDNLYCPWNTKEEFMIAKATNTPRMIELRDFLQRTIVIQSEYMVRRLEEVVPDLLRSAPTYGERAFISENVKTLASTPSGVYALVDFLNFKGAGVSSSRRNYDIGTGLLHVLKGMKSAPRGSTPLQAYVWSAKNALMRRVWQSSPHAHRERWLAGWFNRVNTYLTDGSTQAIILPRFQSTFRDVRYISAG